MREWARVGRALEELPLLREAVISGEVSWTVARLIVGVVSPENEAACLETVRGRTVRAVEALLRAVAPADGSPAGVERLLWRWHTVFDASTNSGDHCC